MSKISKEAFNHWNLIDENGYARFGYVFDDELEPLRDEIVKKMQHTLYMMKFAYQCLYPNERPLSKRDYGRLKFTERQIENKADMLWNCKTKSEDEAFQRGWRRLQIGKGLYPFGICESEAIEKDEEIKRYYETGRYKRGGFVDKFIAHIHHI